MNTDNMITQVHCELDRLRKCLASKPRDLLLFELLLQDGVKVKDVLSLKTKDLYSCEQNKKLELDKFSVKPMVTAQVKDSFEQLLMGNNLIAEDYIFKSRKGDAPLTTTSVSRLLRATLKKAKLEHYQGIVELRENFGPLLSLNNDSGSKQDQANTNDSFLAPHKVSSIAQVAYNGLLEGIIKGKVLPGQKLLTEKIASELSVSRTPVREALGRLEAKGFVTHHPQKGWIVSELSRKNLSEIFQLRVLLECEAISLSAKNIKPETLEELDGPLHKFEQINEEDNPIDSFAANMEFHMIVYRDAGSDMMIESIKELWDRSSPYYQILFRQSMVPKPTSGVNHHIKIVEALKEGNPVKAKEWLRKDIIKPMDFMFEIFDMYLNTID